MASRFNPPPARRKRSEGAEFAWVAALGCLFMAGPELAMLSGMWFFNLPYGWWLS